MTILDLKKRFEEADIVLNNINCALLAGAQKVHIEDIQKELKYLYARIEQMKPEVKNLTIANYKL